MTKPTMPTPDTTVYGKDRFTAPKHAYFHENVLALNKAWATYHEAAIHAAVAEEREAIALMVESHCWIYPELPPTRFVRLVAKAIRARGAAHD